MNNEQLQAIITKTPTNIYREPIKEKFDFIGTLEMDDKFKVQASNMWYKKNEKQNNTSKFYYNPRWNYSDFCAQA